MTVREVAEAAVKLYSEKKSMSPPGATIALEGYFSGVIKGTITVGQAWVARLLIENGWKEAERETIKSIFASGMCCEGQYLGESRVKGFVERG